MNKTSILKFSFFIILILIISGALFIYKNKQINIVETQTNNFIQNNDEETKIAEISKEQIDTKIDTLKKKISLKWLIAKWNSFYEQEEYTIALIKFLQISKEIPNDQETLNKIWNIYYEMKKFDKAYNYYSKITDYINLDKEKSINSLIFSYTNKLTKENVDTILKEIDKFKLNEPELFYYKNSLSCIEDFSLCKLNFEKHINTNNSQTWSLATNWNNKKIEFKNLENINNALINYNNFKLDDLSYKNALISGAFFSNASYSLAIEISKKILLEKPNYKPILKIIAKSYYELWFYDDAKKFLIQFNEIDESDPEINYFLWIIYQKLHSYVLSSIHFKKAIDSWYTNTIEARRRIIFNYSEVWETQKMLTAFKDLINKEKDKLELEDLNLAIYFHLNNSELETAEVFSNYWLKNFENKSIFYWYLWWIQLEKSSSLKNIKNTRDLKKLEKLINSNILDNIQNINNSTGSLNWSGALNSTGSLNWKNNISSIDLENLKNFRSLKIAENLLYKWYILDKFNPMINYLLWILELKKQNTKKAIIFFKTSINLDEKWEFWIRAENKLNLINKKNDIRKE